MTHRTATIKQSRSRFRFIGETINELKKVVWLSKREVAYLTFLVLVVAIAVGVILGAFDYGLAQLVDRVFTGG